MPLFRGTRDKGDVKKHQVFHHGEFSMVEIHGWKYGKKEKKHGEFPSGFFWSHEKHLVQKIRGLIEDFSLGPGPESTLHRTGD